MTIDQISIFVENKPGRLAEVTEVLGSAGVDIRAMSLADTQDFGILRLIVENPVHALEVLKAAECVVSVTQVMAVSIADAPGSLSKVLRALSESQISVEYLYAFITRQAGSAYVIIRVEDTERAVGVLADHGIATASPEELYGL